MNQNNKHTKTVLIVLFIAGVCLLGAGYLSEKGAWKKHNDTTTEATYKSELENMLRGIDGIGEMKFMIHTQGTGDEFTITGVAIICQGGENPKVQKDIIGIIGALWGVPSNRIYVTTMT